MSISKGTSVRCADCEEDIQENQAEEESQRFYHWSCERIFLLKIEYALLSVFPEFAGNNHLNIRAAKRIPRACRQQPLKYSNFLPERNRKKIQSTVDIS